MAHFSSTIRTIAANLNAGFTRQHLFHGNTAYVEMVTALAPNTRFIGAAGQLSDVEADVRAEIAAWRTDPLSQYLDAILGPNEPNGNDTGFSIGGPANTVRQMWWIADEVANGGTWTHRTASAPPMVVGPALKRAGFTGDDDTQYDADIAALAAATYNPGTGALHLNDFPAAFPTLTFALDFHKYLGVNAPGIRVNGLDSNGDMPASLSLSGVDSKSSLLDFEVALAQQIAPAIPVGYWTETGWTDADSTPTLAQRASYAVEGYLRAFKAGIKSAQYELVDEYPLYGTREDYFGLYRPIDNPNGAAGPKPIYTAMQNLFGYTGTAPFTGVGWFEPLAGNNPDQQVVVLPKAAGGWDVFILWEARTSTDFVVAAGYHVVGRHRTSLDSFGNKHYTIASGGNTMTILSVVEGAGSLFAPEWLEV